MDSITKICTLCFIEKPLNEFSYQAKGKHQKRSRCRVCCAQLLHKYRAENQTQIKAQRREHYQTTNGKEYAAKKRLANPQKHRDAVKKWRLNNPEKHAKKLKAYREQNPERIKENWRAWSSKNAEKLSAKKRTRRALLKTNQTEFYSTKDILDKWGSDCHICGLPIDLNAPRWNALEGWENGLHLDHVIPLSKGGVNDASNVKPAHAKCNLLKGNKLTANGF